MPKMKYSRYLYRVLASSKAQVVVWTEGRFSRVHRQAVNLWEESMMYRAGIKAQTHRRLTLNSAQTRERTSPHIVVRSSFIVTSGDLLASPLRQP